ncbi:MAG TPA: hypothetical protein VMY87_08940, partial [Armatimonadota bacterium]|nr:hypothetical protein [Armatimonadota bacterium]
TMARIRYSPGRGVLRLSRGDFGANRSLAIPRGIPARSSGPRLGWIEQEQEIAVRSSGGKLHRRRLYWQ